MNFLSGLKNIYNVNDIDYSKDPFKYIGKLKIKGIKTSGRCTGIIIDKNLILTANHCYKGNNIKFYPQYNINKFKDKWYIKEVIQFEKHSKETRERDYIFLIVKQKLINNKLTSIGDVYGWKSININNNFYNNNNIFYGVGYPTNYYLEKTDYGIVLEDIKLIIINYVNYIYFNFISNPGMSGGPIFNENNELVSIIRGGRYIKHNINYEVTTGIKFDNNFIENYLKSIELSNNYIEYENILEEENNLIKEFEKKYKNKSKKEFIKDIIEEDLY